MIDRVAWLGRRGNAIIAWQAHLMSEVAGWLYLAGAFFVTFNVVTRRFFGFSSPAVVEITGYILAFGISWGLSETLLSRGHIRVDVLLSRLPLKLRSTLSIVSLIILLAFSAWLAWRGFGVVTRSLELGSRDTTALGLPLAYPQAVWEFGLIVLAITTASLLVRSLASLIQGRHQDVDELLRTVSEREAAEELLSEVSAHAGSPSDKEA